MYEVFYFEPPVLFTKNEKNPAKYKLSYMQPQRAMQSARDIHWSLVTTVQHSLSAFIV